MSHSLTFVHLGLQLVHRCHGGRELELAGDDGEGPGGGAQQVRHQQKGDVGIDPLQVLKLS